MVGSETQQPSLTGPGRVRRSSSSERVFELLRTSIVAGELVAGSQHSVYRLAEELDVSRTPVREAVLRLADLGLVTVERNRGVRIRGVSVDDVRFVFELRLMIEVPAVAYAAAVAGDELVEALDAELEAMQRCAETEDEAAFTRHDRALHAALAAPLGNPRVLAELTRLRDTVQVRGVSTIGRSREMTAVESEHEPIVAAIRTRDVAASTLAMWTHLVHTGTLLMRQVSGSAEVDDGWAERLVPLVLGAPSRE
ncbi:MAG: GntR family transcriptional regulator [Marmoricola sp.]|nr:GntR family transcriptional regulator [Marmoricola sp.]